MTEVKPPRGTGPAGKAIWASISGAFDLEAHEVQVLGQVAKVADRIDALDRAVTRDGVLVDGRAHPALVESRLQRVTLARLLVTLRLPDPEDVRPQRRGGYRRSYQLRRVMGGDGSA
jgi:hypothetical protein